MTVYAWGLHNVVLLPILASLVALCVYSVRLRARLKRSQVRLAQAEAEWVQALDFAEDAMYLVDLDDNVVRGNRAFFNLIGRPPEQAIGVNVMVLFHGGREDEPCPVCRARLERRDAIFVKEADDPGNHRGRPSEIIVKMIRDRQGRPVGVLHVNRDLSRQRAAERAVRESENRFRRLSQAAFEGIAIHDGGTIIDANQALAGMIGVSAGDLIGVQAESLLADASRGVIRQQIASRSPQPFEIEVLRRDGNTFIAEARARSFLHQGRTMEIVAIRDITELRRIQEALFSEKERLMVTLESIGEAVITTDIDGTVQYLNPVAHKLTGWENMQARGRQLADVFCLVDEATEDVLSDPVNRCLREDRLLLRDGTLRRRDDQEFAIEYSMAPIRDREGGVIGAVLTFRDVTEIRSLAHQLAYQASHDVLTGLINRREFELRLAKSLEAAKRDRRAHALCYLDVDQFKVVNDTCGHAAGDQLLRQLTVLLRGELRSGDVLARLGGDEFAVLLENCPLLNAREIADALRRAVRDFRFVWHDKTFDVGVSIGVVPIAPDTIGVAEALSAADAACYVAKDLGRNRVYVYHSDDAAVAKHHGEMEWAGRIVRAIEAGRLRLYCQPIVPLSANCTERPLFEILVRMIDERSGELVPPMAFIPAAERYGVMPAVDRWVVREVLQVLAQHPGVCDFTINLSGRSLGDDQFLQFVREQFVRSPVVDHVCFEITETAAITNFSQAHGFISALKRQGCRFALDDFGSGLSSFAYLKSLPVDFLKIDGGFVHDMVSDPIDAAMVESINQLGHVMGIRTIAEHVETEAVLASLRALGVDFAQGYAIAKPLPIEDALAVPGIFTRHSA